MIQELLTIIIPCKNEEKYISDLLESLRKQKDLKKTKIIISDNESTDKTLSLIQSYKKYLNITVTNGGLPAVSRNIGSKHVKTKYVLFIDADVIIYDDFLISRSLEKMIINDYDLVSAKLNSKILSVKILYKMCNILIWLSKFNKPFCTGMFMLVKSNVFKNLGGFPEDAMHCEDYLFSKKISRKKFGIINKYVYSDDRRFKKIGYIGMVKYMIKNIINRNNESYFKKDINYWI